MSSLSATAHKVLSPLAHDLPVAAVWAVAAALVPFVSKPRSLPISLVLTAVWAATTASAATTILGAQAAPDAAALGAVVGALVVVAPSAHRAWRTRSVWLDFRSMEPR